MNGEEIRALVLVKLEEHTPFGDTGSERLLAGGDVLSEVKPLYSYIDSTLDEAADEMLLLAPLSKLSGVSKDMSDVSCHADEDDESGYIIKPSDWLRLYTFQMSGWSKPLHEVVYPEDYRYALQFSRWTRGSIVKPVVIDDGECLRYYSVRRGIHAVKALRYISKFDSSTDYPRSVGELIALNTALKIHNIFGNKEESERLLSEMESLRQMMML